MAGERFEPGTAIPEEAQRCTAAANIAGKHIPCDERADHVGWAHGNREHRIIWDGPLPHLGPVVHADTDAELIGDALGLLWVKAPPDLRARIVDMCKRTGLRIAVDA